METIVLIGILIALFLIWIDYKPINQRIRESDADPKNPVKSDKWKQEHLENKN